MFKGLLYFIYHTAQVGLEGQGTRPAHFYMRGVPPLCW